MMQLMMVVMMITIYMENPLSEASLLQWESKKGQKESFALIVIHFHRDLEL